MAYTAENSLDSPVTHAVQRVIGAYSGGVAITPSDSVDLAPMICGLIVTTSGAVKLTFSDGTTVIPYLLSGVEYHLVVKRVWSTGTDHTSGIVGLY